MKGTLIVVSNAAVLFLDVVFIAWIPIGTAGTAFATVLAQNFPQQTVLYSVGVQYFGRDKRKAGKDFPA